MELSTLALAPCARSGVSAVPPMGAEKLVPIPCLNAGIIVGGPVSMAFKADWVRFVPSQPHQKLLGCFGVLEQYQLSISHWRIHFSVAVPYLARTGPARKRRHGARLSQPQHGERH